VMRNVCLHGQARGRLVSLVCLSVVRLLAHACLCVLLPSVLSFHPSDVPRRDLVGIIRCVNFAAFERHSSSFGQYWWFRADRAVVNCKRAQQSPPVSQTLKPAAESRRQCDTAVNIADRSGQQSMEKAAQRRTGSRVEAAIGPRLVDLANHEVARRSRDGGRVVGDLWNEGPPHRAELMRQPAGQTDRQAQKRRNCPGLLAHAPQTTWAAGLGRKSLLPSAGSSGSRSTPTA
jgi:hypothetical protein